MQINPLRNDLVKFLKNHGLKKKVNKQKSLFENNPQHPSLNTELLEPKSLKLYSFRINIKYRAVFIIVEGNAEIIDINKHYR